MNTSIPPLSERGQTELERRADALLEAAGAEVGETWPGFWPQREETEFERIAAAHTGMIPLSWAPIAAALPTFDPQSHRRDVQSDMQKRPGAGEPDPYAELLSLLSETEAQYGSGFLVERRNYPPDSCQWAGCREPFHASPSTRKRGRPRRYCQGHQKPARARTRRLRYGGVQVGRNRNLVYDFAGIAEQDLTGYRELWGPINTTGT
ncbi:hypothetical protein [Streptomyces sp. H39-C1]|uniref:hypothetical protein n=1 Tax=Streptomyces sp. H39-C1 TaxID=3004355 RepID=UPI0022B01BA3|nr:hypothetical protein [Streptomyces sp. H39-C1]MCZ4101711.1 hypothetical protein [Streptomyces sp. H39-C1]